MFGHNDRTSDNALLARVMYAVFPYKCARNQLDLPPVSNENQQLGTKSNTGKQTDQPSALGFAPRRNTTQPLIAALSGGGAKGYTGLDPTSPSAQLRKVQEELRIQRELEERQSVELIRQLHDEDRAMRAEHDLRMKKDRLVASQETCSSTVNDALKLRSMSAGQKHTSSCSEMTTRVASAPVRCNAEFQAPPGPGKENKRQHASSRSKSRETSSNPSSTFLLPSNPSSSLSSLSGSSGGSMAMESGGGFASQASSSGGVVDAATTSSGGSSSSSSSKGKHHRSHSVESNDSISEELRHFKPIHAMPRTPPRRMTSVETDERSDLVRTIDRSLESFIDAVTGYPSSV
ncbi:PREDICTED: E3 ubiquitin-protein ligase RNF169-like [Priapulus caudatus]|uniref:E3 ubiquitin-protein ligase RNF169-like n=1 Tax=Priapulus caudatus TaxID=37621 RepID=A0ABM1EHQ0_PRICU|nr:PREDICTED: E3 ubiquitin-protein ligase RNF169-like [Priapulus caudatus]